MINLQTIEQMHNTKAIKSGISRFSGCLYRFPKRQPETKKTVPPIK
mgnify:CR=1 FL=1